MHTANTRTQWEGAAPGRARWEATIAGWMEPATEAMLAMAGVDPGARVLDLASGAAAPNRALGSTASAPLRSRSGSGSPPALEG